jgi:hypothetical protein
LVEMFTVPRDLGFRRVCLNALLPRHPLLEASKLHIKYETCDFSSCSSEGEIGECINQYCSG